MARTWNAVLARLGVPTGDGRIIDPAGGSSRDLPLPISWQEKSEEGHGGSRVVGRMETLRIADGMVTATGSMLEHIPSEVLEQLEAGVIGPSVDLDDVEYVMDENERIVVTKWRVSGATLVSIPAFADVSLTLDPLPAVDMDAPPESPEWRPETPDPGPLYDDGRPRALDWEPFSLRASVRSEGWSDLPIADASHAWDGAAAADRVLTWATEDGETDWSRYARAFLAKDDDANPDTKGAYSFGIADIVDGELTIIPRGVFAAAAAVQGARSGEAPEDAESMKRVLRSLYERMDRPAPFTNSHWAQWDLLASATATKQLPPIAWFDQPDLDRLTPITISNTGRIFGHIAGRDTCHVGLPGCVTPPMGYSTYANFHVAAQETAEGVLLPVGTLVAGPRHADPQLAFRAAQDHYDDVNARVAKVVAGEDEFGIWVAGWLLPDAKPEAVEVFKSSPVSGDWRWIGGQLELIGVCSVNTPGFPVPRARVAFGVYEKPARDVYKGYYEKGVQKTLIYSNGLLPVEGEKVPNPSFALGAQKQPTTVVSHTATNDLARARLAWTLANLEA